MSDNEKITIELEPIGRIHTPYDDPEGMPIQPAGAAGTEGTVTVYEPYRPGLADLEGFSHVFLLYHFHLARGFDLRVVPFLDTQSRGLFATRAPKRPNPIGLSVVELERIEDGVLYVRNIDVLNGTPLLDIKPYAPQFDKPENVRTGWLETSEKAVSSRKSDDRFK